MRRLEIYSLKKTWPKCFLKIKTIKIKDTEYHFTKIYKFIKFIKKLYFHSIFTFLLRILQKIYFWFNCYFHEDTLNKWKLLNMPNSLRLNKWVETLLKFTWVWILIWIIYRTRMMRHHQISNKISLPFLCASLINFLRIDPTFVLSVNLHKEILLHLNSMFFTYKDLKVIIFGSGTINSLKKCLSILLIWKNLNFFYEYSSTIFNIHEIIWK